MWQFDASTLKIRSCRVDDDCQFCAQISRLTWVSSLISNVDMQQQGKMCRNSSLQLFNIPSYPFYSLCSLRVHSVIRIWRKDASDDEHGTQMENDTSLLSKLKILAWFSPPHFHSRYKLECEISKKCIRMHTLRSRWFPLRSFKGSSDWKLLQTSHMH